MNDRDFAEWVLKNQPEIIDKYIAEVSIELSPDQVVSEYFHDLVEWHLKQIVLAFCVPSGAFEDDE